MERASPVGRTCPTAEMTALMTWMMTRIDHGTHAGVALSPPSVGGTERRGSQRGALTTATAVSSLREAER